MLKPKRSFRAVVTELIEGLRSGEVQLQGPFEGTSHIPAAPVDGSLAGGEAKAGSGLPLTEQEITARARRKG